MATTQITVRIPNDLVKFADDQKQGRAAVITRALERERRRDLAERDAEIYAKTADPDGFAALAAYGAAHLPDLD